jgi:hypothetical protein
MDFNDRVAALLSCAVYSEKQDAKQFEEKLPKGWVKRATREHAESGLFCVLVVKVCLCVNLRNELPCMQLGDFDQLLSVSRGACHCNRPRMYIIWLHDCRIAFRRSSPFAYEEHKILKYMQLAVSNRSMFPS